MSVQVNDGQNFQNFAKQKKKITLRCKVDIKIE